MKLKLIKPDAGKESVALRGRVAWLWRSAPAVKDTLYTYGWRLELFWRLRRLSPRHRT